MSYALIPLVAVLAWISFIICVAIGYGITLEVIGRVRRWRRKCRWKKAAAKTFNIRTLMWG